jgi:ribonucleoside-diphosphate reductase alpha chain
MSQKTKTRERQQTIETPIKSVDYSQSVDDRMTDNALYNILPARYLLRDDEGNVVEEPTNLFQRVADNVAKAELEWGDEEDYEKWRAEFREVMETLQFMPNSPTLMNAGAELQQLSACFVLEVGDSMVFPDEDDDHPSIMETAKEAAAIFKSGGGVGYAFHHLRPKGAMVTSTGGVSSGPISFMEIFNKVCGTVEQGGKRRGAQMGIMRVDHPDIGRFVTAKRREGEFDNFNISTGLTDEFVEAVENDDVYTLYDPAKDFDEPFTAVEHSEYFYKPQYQNNPESAFDDGDGKPITENFWRDYADEMEAWDWESEETVPFREKWEDKFTEEAIVEGEELQLPARFIWDMIIDGAHKNGEPGLFYYDETNRQHSFDAEEYPEHSVEATNPCLTGDTLVNTPDGPREVSEIEEGDRIATTRGSETVDEVVCFDDEVVYEVEFSDGGTLRATGDHRFHVLNGKRSEDIPLRDIEEGDYVRLHPSSVSDSGSDEQYLRQLRRGILVGDGCYTESTIQHNNTLSISTNEKDETYNEKLVALFEDAEYTVTKDTSGNGNSMKYWVGPANEVLNEHSLNPAKSHEKTVDVSDFETESQIVGFLDGLLASDGNVNLSTNRPQVRWTSASDDLTEDIRTLALNIGAHARIYEDQRKARGGTRKDGSKILSDRTVSDVHIAGESLRKYAQKSRLDNIHPEKGSLIREAQDSWALTGGSWKATVESIKRLEEKETVYDLYCSGSDTWITEGYVQRGCAEQPLSEFEACNLGHINLSLMLEDDAPTYQEWEESTDMKFTDERSKVQNYMQEAVDYDQLERVAETGTRFLDNVVTQSDFPLEEISERVEGQRKIGLGIMGFAQMLFQMGIPYGSDESYTVAKRIMHHIDWYSKQVSHGLAQERGTFEYWDESKFANPTKYPEWFENHVYENPEDWADGYPIRNHNTTTIAPTGTTSMLGKTTGGCEPLHNVAFFKNVGEDIQGDDFLVEFDDYFLDTLEANGIDPEKIKEQAERQMRNNEFTGVDSLDVPEKIADIFVTTNELSSKQHTTMQRAFQEHTDSGISKTINAPNSATHADVHEAFLLALDRDDDTLGQTIKGLTFYREGSRSEEVVTTSETNKNRKGEEIIDELVEMYEEDEVNEKTMEKLGLLN